MAKTKRISTPAVAALPGEQRVVRLGDVGSMLSPFGGWGTGAGNGHQGADNTFARGMVYWPQMDTRKEITSYTRTEISRKVRFLYANVGLARRIVNGVARMVAGTGLMPRPKTFDVEWNKLALRRIEAVYGSAQVYDLSGRFTGYRSQRVKLRCRYRDGDGFTVFVRGADNRASTLFYESHQCGNGQTAPGDEEKFCDGIARDKHLRPLLYRFLGDNSAQIDLPAASVAHLIDHERAGQARGLSILAHAIPHTLDRTEAIAFFKGSIKNAARVGYYIGTAKDAMPTRTPRPGEERTVIRTGSGKKVNLDRVLTSHGGNLEELDPGQELKILLDERPHPNTQAFLDELVRDISLGCDLSPEVLYNIVKLGGANVRYVMADAQSFIEAEQQVLVDTTLGPEYIWLLADEIASGRLPRCQDAEWWKHDWITPARMTVDIGRDGKLHLEQLRSGALTFRRFFGWQGLGLDEIDEWLDEYAYIAAGAKARGLDPERVLAAIYGRPSMPSAPAGDGAADPLNDNPDGTAGGDPNADQ